MHATTKRRVPILFMNTLTKHEILSLIFHDGFYETKWIKKEIGVKLRDLDPECVLWHVDFDGTIETPKDNSYVLIITHKAWMDNSGRREKLKASLEIEKTRIDKKNEHIEKVRGLLKDKGVHEKLVEEFINRALFPKEPSDFVLKEKFKFNFEN